jgi:putative heme-binding domain-containing protein
MAATAATAPSAGPGDAARGKVIVDGRGQCRRCHRVDGTGSQLGPDLNAIAPFRRRTELERSLVDPNAEVLDDNRFARVVLRSGETISGRLLNQDTFSIQLFDAKERLLSYAKSDLREYAILKTSPMPSYKDTLNADERADVISYLRSLKGKP